MHTSYTTEMITQQRMAENAQRARIHADRAVARRTRRTLTLPRIAWRRRQAVRTA